VKLNRTNMIEHSAEGWRPPLLIRETGVVTGIVVRVRRFFDLQAGSIWNDLSEMLPQARGVVLDVGCGVQPYRGLVHPQAIYRGIDTDAAKDDFGYHAPDTDLFSGDTWPVADESVDLVLCTETLEHVFDTPRFLAEMARCLKPGGLVLLTVPFAARWHFLPNDYWRFTPNSLDQLLRSIGCVDVCVYARGNAGTVACYKVIALIVRLLMPQKSGSVRGWLERLAGLALSPVLVVLAVIGNLSLLGRGGEDCIGYTVVATKPGSLGS
jgi:SAM-dependent methyltransferase